MNTKHKYFHHLVADFFVVETFEKKWNNYFLALHDSMK